MSTDVKQTTARKAKEYAEIFTATFNGTEKSLHEAVSEMCIGFLEDLQFLMESRKAQSNSAALAIMRELQQKWRSLSRKLEAHYGAPILKEDGFEIFIKVEHPELYRIWKML